MSMRRRPRRDRTRDRRKITRGSASRRRFARAEALEPRVVLDGGGLGQISPDFLPTIPLPETIWVVQDAFGTSDNGGEHFRTITRADGSPLSILDLDLSFTVAPGSGAAPVALPNGNLSYVVIDQAGSGDHDTGQGQQQEFRDSPLFDSIANNGSQPTDSSSEPTLNQSAGDLNVVAIPQLKDTDSIRAEVVVGDSVGEFDTGGQRRDNETPGDSTLLADHQGSHSLADPGVIALPEPQRGFLPADRAARPHPAGRAAPMATQPMIAAVDPPPAKSSDAASESRSSPAQVAAHAANRGSRGAESGKTAAISADRYFASYQQRTPVAWSTQSAASEMRRHVRQTSYQDDWGEGRETRAVDVAHRASSMFAVGGGENACGRWLVTIAGEQAEMVASGWIASTASQWMTVPNAGESSRVEQGVIESSRSELAFDTTAAPLQTRLYQLAVAPYQPLAVLVGVSLVSAHVIADASPQTLRKKKRARNR